jgi:hypothetical protein
MAPTPKSILEIQNVNPPPPAADPTRGDLWWSTKGGQSFPQDRDLEWDQILAPGEEYDESLVGVTGWVLNPHITNIDLPMTHPFLDLAFNFDGSIKQVNGDWEFKMMPDEQYITLVTVANGRLDEPDGTIVDPLIDHAINDLKLPWPAGLNGLLGVEIESKLVPPGFQNRVKEGDRVALFGRWIIDQGHPNKNLDAYRAEIHPPLLMASGSIQQDAAGAEFTRVVFTSRPYLPGQRYTTDQNSAYDDSAGDDGAFKGHLFNELGKVLLPPLSFKVSFHNKIKSHPFLGTHLLHFIVRPPPLSGHVIGGVRPPMDLAVSFNFTVRKGVAVEVTSLASGQVDVLIAMNSLEYNPPPLPPRQDQNWTRGDLNLVGPKTGVLNMGAGDLIFNVAELLLGALNPEVILVLDSGVICDLYDGPAGVTVLETLDTRGAVLNATAFPIPAGQGITQNDSASAFPVAGWLEAKWVVSTIRV